MIHDSCIMHEYQQSDVTQNITKQFTICLTAPTLPTKQPCDLTHPRYVVRANTGNRRKRRPLRGDRRTTPSEIKLAAAVSA